MWRYFVTNNSQSIKHSLLQQSKIYILLLQVQTLPLKKNSFVSVGGLLDAGAGLCVMAASKVSGPCRKQNPSRYTYATLTPN
jgi:hypothetical protein